jgi:hypothetical protein
MKEKEQEMHKLISTLMLLYSFAAAPLWAATYFVDPVSGNNANSGLSTMTAWANIPGSVGVEGSGWAASVRNGDIIYVKGGTTSNMQVLFNSSRYSGEPSFDSVRIVSGHLADTPWGDGRAIFDGQQSRYYGFGLDGTGITVDGFEIRNIAAATNSGVAGNGSAAIEIGNNAKFIKIRNCFLHHVTRTVDDTGHGIESATGASYIIIEYNHIGPNIGTKGIEIYNSDYGIIRHNYIVNSGDHNLVISAYHWDVYNNLISAVGPWVHNPIYGVKITGSYNDIWNNVIICDSATGIDAVGFGFSLPNSGTGGDNNRFIHNTVLGYGTKADWGESGVSLVFGVGGTATTNNYAYNNLLLNAHNGKGGIQLFYYNKTVNGTLKYNDFWYDTGIVITYGERTGPPSYTLAEFESLGLPGVGNNQQQDPQLLGGTLPSGLDSAYHPNTDYMKLTPQTPAEIRATSNHIDGDATHGYSSASDKFSTDIIGNTRSLWSMGAYEYVAHGKLAAPDNLTVVGPSPN